MAMMTHFLLLIRRFRDNESGAFAIMFGVVAIVVIALAGSVVDYVSVEQARTKGQVALDAAALCVHG